MPVLITSVPKTNKSKRFEIDGYKATWETSDGGFHTLYAPTLPELNRKIEIEFAKNLLPV